MNFINKDPETGGIIILGTTREQLKKYYKNSFAYNSLSQKFNEFAPEIAGKQIFPATSVAKIVENMGYAHVTLEESVLI